MSDDEARRIASHEEEGDEVEAHKRRLTANEEAGDEADGDDVEAHSRRLTSPDEGPSSGRAN